jgi:hypothetical protein
VRTLQVLALAVATATVAVAPSDSATRPPRRVQQAVLEEILRGFPGTKVTGRVGAPTRDRRLRRHASFARSTWLYFKIRPRDSVEFVQQSWEADVAEGLLAGISRSRGWRPVTGQTITLVLPDGKERFESASIHGGAFRGGIAHATEPEAEESVCQSAASVGAAVRSVRFPKPLGRLAVEIVVITDRPETFATRPLANASEIIAPLRGRAEGAYLEVWAADGRWVAALGTSTRTASTVSTINPAFR